MYEQETLEMEEMGELEEPEFMGEEESPSYEGELEEEASYESLEADPFVGDVLRRAVPALSKALRSGSPEQALKGMAKQMAQVAGAAVAGPEGARIASTVADRCLREDETEGDYEEEAFVEQELEGVDHQALDEANYNAYMASEAETEEEADRFLGALVPMLSQVAGPLLSGIFGGGDSERDPFLGDILGGLLGEEETGESEDHFMGDILGGILGEQVGEADRDEFLPALIPMVAPLIAKGIGAIGKALNRNPRSRRAIKALPQVAVRAARDVGRMSRGPRPVNRRAVAGAVARQATRTLASRPRLRRAVQANRVHTRHAQARPNGYRPQPRRISQGVGTAPQSRRRLIGYIPVYRARLRAPL
jgi:hypothetical protein